MKITRNQWVDGVCSVFVLSVSATFLAAAIWLLCHLGG
jgi:hypothetical protein